MAWILDIEVGEADLKKLNTKKKINFKELMFYLEALFIAVIFKQIVAADRIHRSTKKPRTCKIMKI